MDCKECKIVCGEKEIASFEHSKEGFSIKFTEEGKEMFKKHCKCSCKCEDCKCEPCECKE